MGLIAYIPKRLLNWLLDLPDVSLLSVFFILFILFFTLFFLFTEITLYDLLFDIFSIELFTWASYTGYFVILSYSPECKNNDTSHILFFVIPTTE